MTERSSKDPSPGNSTSSLKRRLSRLTRSGWLSRQHGGWPMTIVPVFVGSAIGGFTWLQLLLLISWLVAFQFFDALGLWIQSVVPRRRSRNQELRLARGRKYVTPLLAYGVTAAVGALALVVSHPRLLLYGLAIAPLALVSLYEMWVGRPRSFLARASAICASVLLSPMAFELGSHPVDWPYLWYVTVVLAAYFIGTIAYVKTMIRERGNPTWLRISIGYHVAFAILFTITALAGWSSWLMAATWVVLAARAWAFPYLSRRKGAPLKPVIFGSSEFFFCALVVAALLQ